MSQLAGKPAEESNPASMMLDILAGTKNKTAAEVAVEIATDAPKLCGQASRKVWSRLRCDKFHRSVCFSTVGRTRSRSKMCGASGSRRS